MDRHLDPGELLSQALTVLIGQEFGRSHEGSLHAVADSGQQNARRHDRFPATDVTLQETVHRPGASHVLEDLGHDALLGPGEGESKTFEVPPDEGPPGGEGGPGAPPNPPTPIGQQQFEEEELLVRQTPPGG
jgi:hypothetical protein